MQINQSLYADENLLARLDRTPITRTTVGIIALLSIVWLAEAFDAKDNKGSHQVNFI